jgi:2-polyprenyl-3-methyl-5-hydroxy-6-metoxy-1,4-benzoquinol methylase
LNNIQSSEAKIQEAQYDFPYHYIPHFSSTGVPSLARRMTWGLEYLCYQMHLREKVVVLQPGSVLEVGCGDGYFVGGLPGEIPVRVGIDLSVRAIAFARAFHPTCQFYTGDVATLDGQFDVVAAIEVLEHVPDDMLPGFFRELHRKLGPLGILLISVPTTVVPRHKKHYRHYTLELLEEQLELSGIPLVVDAVEYVYRNPWWERLLSRFLDNPLFSLEVKSVTRLAWHRVWNKYRFADARTGRHMVVTLRAPGQTK